VSARIRLALAGLAAILLLTGAATAARAADTLVAPDARAREATALDGTVVWVSGSPSKGQRLMLVDAQGVRPVPGAPTARSYQAPDLGKAADGAPVLSYLRCTTFSRCVAYRDDLHRHRTRFTGLRPAGCTFTTTPAIWGDRVAYAAHCAKRPGGTGLYVRTGSGRPKRMSRPVDAVKFGIRAASSVDLRGGTVAGVFADVYEYVTWQRVDATHRRSYFAAGSEGDADEHVTGLQLAPGGAVWSLVDAFSAASPYSAVIRRTVGRCTEAESIYAADDAARPVATDLAVDGTTLYLVEPGRGIVRHAFTPTNRTC
jgi:hypothetical protein